jgi:acyl-[acyl-carrier-protein]-phospholipid O-acyltransferase/long-chain-fatty-acid--[acyl-carrier-protein] ligase
MTSWRWPGFTAMILIAGLFLAFRDAADRYGKAGAVLEDALGGKLTYKRMLVGARALGVRL